MVKKLLFIISATTAFCLAGNQSVFAASCAPTGPGLGGNGGAPQSNGAAGTCASSTGGNSGGGGGGGGSAAGGSGGNGAGGGVLLKNLSGTVTVTGTIDTRGGGASTSNGGTVKIFYTGATPSTAGITAGRTFLSTGTTPSTFLLMSPSDGATAVRGMPTFRFRAADVESDYLQYKFDICADSSCSSVIRTVDQTVSQANWFGQDANGGTAYASTPDASNSTIAVYQMTDQPLTPLTTYWWRIYAFDPAGSNIWSSASSIQSFTIDSVKNIQITGGGQIIGGGHIR